MRISTYSHKDAKSRVMAMVKCQYLLKSNVGKDFSRFITNLNIVGEFDPEWLDSNLDLAKLTV